MHWLVKAALRHNNVSLYTIKTNVSAMLLNIALHHYNCLHQATL